MEFAGDTQTLLMWTMEGHMWGQRRGRSNFRSMMPTLASQSGPSVSITLMAVQTGLSLPGPRCIRHWRWEIRRTRKQTPSLLFPNLEVLGTGTPLPDVAGRSKDWQLCKSARRLLSVCPAQARLGQSGMIQGWLAGSLSTFPARFATGEKSVGWSQQDDWGPRCR